MTKKYSTNVFEEKQNINLKVKSQKCS